MRTWVTPDLAASGSVRCAIIRRILGFRNIKLIRPRRIPLRERPIPSTSPITFVRSITPYRQHELIHTSIKPAINASDTMSIQPTPLPRRRFQGWQVILVGAFILAVWRKANFNVLPPVAATILTGIPIIQTVADLPPWLWMFANALPILLMPLVGRAIDRWGPRRVTLYGLTTIVAAFIIDHWTHFPGDSHLIIFIVGTGAVVSGTLPMATTINNWYRRRRATAMALMMTPSIIVFTVLLAFGISHAFAQQLNAYTGIIATAFILLAMSLLIRTLVRNRPEDYGQLPDGATPPAPQNENQMDSISPQSTAPEWEWRQALNSRVFWLLTAGGSASAIAAGRNLYIAPLVIHRGLTLANASITVMLASFATIIFTVIAGWLADRLPIRYVIFGFALTEAVAMMLLAFAHSLPMFYLSGALAGIGDAAGTALILAAVGAYFGRRHFGTIAGMSLLPITILRIITPFAIGLVYDATENLTFTILAPTLASAIAPIAYLFAGNPATPPLHARTENPV